MTVIFENIVKSFNGIEIFSGISGRINEGDKIGLIGINGIGKTTLVNILMGKEEYDTGVIHIVPEYMKIGYLKQHPDFQSDITVYENIMKLSYSANSRANMDSYGRKLKRALSNLGFKEKDLNKKASKLSGGEKTKLSLCMVLADNPDMLILDEPTNHLDVETINWLEEFLNSIKKTMIIISHDRYFLDKTVNKIFEMKADKIKEYRGNYSSYKEQLENKVKHLEKEQEKQNKEIKHLEGMILEKMSWFHKAQDIQKKDKYWSQSRHYRKSSVKHIKTIKSKEKKLNKLKLNKIVVPKEEPSAAFEIINKNIGNVQKLPKYLVKINRLKKSFGQKEIFQGATCTIRKNQKVVLLGKNGSGKTTLLKILLGIEGADSGTVSIAPSLKIGYFSQELENLNFSNTVLEEVVNCGIQKQYARNILGCLLFRGNDIYKTVGTLSMGEKCRVAFGKLLTSGNNMLILDEPTNHMDIISKENIERVLKKYEGTIIFVSHDRYFVKSLATRIIEIEEHKLKSYEGNYEYYIEQKQEERKRQESLVDYRSVKDEIIKLECEIAYLSSKLKRQSTDKDKDDEIVQKFFIASERLNQYKEMIN